MEQVNSDHHKLDAPVVSVVIPSRNEAAYIGHCLDNLLLSTFDPLKLEILIIDGLSTDNTKEIASRYSDDFFSLSIIDNSQLITPVAMNLGVLATQGKYILITSAHAAVKPNYIADTVYSLEQHGADAVGGLLKVVPGEDTLFGKVNAVMGAHPFNMGNSSFRTGVVKDGSPFEVETPGYGCVRRDVFAHIGLFNPKLVRGQDREFYARLKRSGGKILLLPKYAAEYSIRSNFKDYIVWMIRNGFWVYYASSFTKTKFRSWRNYVPMIFVLYQILGPLAFTAVNMPGFVYFSPLALYLALVLFYSTKVALHAGDKRYGPVAALIFLSTHYCYGLGSLFGGVSSLYQICVAGRNERIPSVTAGFLTK